MSEDKGEIPAEPSGCARWMSDVQRYHDGELSPPRALEVEAHVASCRSCADTLSDLRAISRAFAGFEAPGASAAHLAALSRVVAENPAPAADWTAWMSRLALAAALVLAMGLGILAYRKAISEPSVATGGLGGYEAVMINPTAAAHTEPVQEPLALAQWLAEDLSRSTTEVRR